ncbi:MAG: hypothetical protein KAR38_16210, partial [Calditrichia bacterium]|nr:hypothetical protein [Calditrichia bacterium]
YTDMNGNGTWDENEPLNDDLGKDGVGPFDRQYNGPDEGEGDGVPTPGEPDFDRTDIDESDQIGLNSMSIYRLVDGGGGDGWPKHDNGLWEKMSSTNFDTSLQRANIHMLFASGPFKLDQAVTERFSMALLFGNDLEDLVANKITVQNIYNANYNFSKPPYKPLLTAIPGDGKVNLFWDDVAEESRDAFLPDSIGNPRKDFEGYLIYRSREPQFTDIKIITDSRGNPVFWKPIAQYDLIDTISGPDPVGVHGARFYRGSDTGLRHSYVDEDVVNGQTYYYACVSYDMGDPDFGTIGLQPTECTKIITEDLVGNIINIDINCAVVTPNAPTPGYVAPQIIGDLDEVTSGIGTGSIGVEILAPEAIKDNTTYRVVFNSDGDFPDYTTTSYDIFEVVGVSLHEGITGIDAIAFGPGNTSPILDGFVVYTEIDTPITLQPAKSGWLIGNSNLNITVVPHSAYASLHVPWPADYKIVFYEDFADTTSFYNIPVKFKILNITGEYEADFEILNDTPENPGLSFGDIITIIEYIGPSYKFTYDVHYNGPINAIPDEPEPGDEYLISTSKQFYQGDYFEFSTSAASEDQEKAKTGLDDIKVVPNPYICGASWEPRLVFGSGRGDRKIDFIHLPAECTIRIFTLAGKLVKLINHNNSYTNGAESWNLITDDGMDIAYGIYIYHINAPGVGEKIGKFAVIK